MITQTLEGTWEEIAQHAPEFIGRRVRLTIIGEEAPKPFRSVKGTLPGNLDNLEKDLSEIRSQMWQNFPREEPK